MRFDHAVRRDLRAHAWDYAVAGAMVGVALVALVARIDVQDADAHLFRPDTWWGWVLTIAVCATLIGRRRWPLRTLAVGLVLVLPLEFAHQRDTVAFFALVIALYGVAASLPPRLAWRGIALMAAFYAALLASSTIVLTAVPVLGLLFLTAAFAFGLVIRRNRTRQHHDAQIALAHAAAAIETSELDAADERLRMARELHDVVAHSLSVIAVQAGIGAHLIDRQPAEATRALRTIRSTCDTTGIELDRLVGVLRNGTVTDSAPAPSIAEVATLVEQIRSSDLAVALIVDGDLAAVPAGVSLAAYRIVQEALTNAVRHAGNRVKTTVTIKATDNHIVLTIDDNGRGVIAHEPRFHGGGNGLLGMNERARMYGGDVEAGPRPGGGFRVRATLDTQTGTHPNSSPMRPAIEATESTNTQGLRPDRRQFSSSTWDAGLALLMAVIATLEVLAAHPTVDGPHFTPTHAWAMTLRLASCATLAFRRRNPTTAYAVAWVLGLALTIGDYQVGAMIFVLWIGLYSIAAYATAQRVIAAVTATFAGIAIIAWSKPPDLTTPGAIWAGVFFTASAVAGHVVRRDRSQRTTTLDEQQNAAAALTRQTRLMLTNERLRIADELGTVITRSIDTIARHAETGTQHVNGDTGVVRDSLQTISTISRDALNDLRRLLKHLRTTANSTNYSPIASSHMLEVDADTVLR